MFGYPCLTLKERPKVKSDHTRRFSAHDFLHVGLPSQTSSTNNKRVISTFKLGYACLILKERPKVKSDHTRRFSDHDFLHIGLPFKTSRINNKQVISIDLEGEAQGKIRPHQKIPSPWFPTCWFIIQNL